MIESKTYDYGLSSIDSKNFILLFLFGDIRLFLSFSWSPSVSYFNYLIWISGYAFIDWNRRQFLFYLRSAYVLDFERTCCPI